MAFLKNIFKKKKKKVEKIEKKKPAKKVAKVSVEPKKKVEKEEPEKKPAPPKFVKPKRGVARVAPRVLREPQITEKATELQKKNQYVFKVFSGASKPEIKKAIEEVYGVDVLAVRTIKVPRKRKRLGRSAGWKRGYKKAIVTVKKGQSIEVMPR